MCVELSITLECKIAKAASHSSVKSQTKVLRVMLLSNNVLYKVWNLEEVARRFVGSLPRIPPIACEAPYYYN